MRIPVRSIILVLLSQSWISKSQLNCSSFISTPAAQGGTKIYYHLDQGIHRCFQANPYDTSIIPVLEGSQFHSVNVTYMFTLEKILVLENSGSLMMSVSFVFFWIDEYRVLVNAEKYMLSTGFVMIPASEVWLPRFTLAQCQSDDCVIQPEDNQHVYVYPKGIVYLKINKFIQSYCQMKLSKFPYDIQTCNIGIFLMDFTANHVFMNAMNDGLRSFYYSSDEWNLLSQSDYTKNLTDARIRQPDGSFITDKTKPTINGIYSGFEVSMQFQRNPSFYIYNLFVPVFVLSAAGFISIFIPSDSSDRINLGVTVLLGFIFMQSLMAALVPKVAKAPYFADYVLHSMLVSGVNMVFTVIVIGIHQFNSDPPKIVKVLGISVLGVIVCRCCRSCKKKNAVDTAKIKENKEVMNDSKVLVETEKKKEIIATKENEKMKPLEKESGASAEDWHEVAINLGRFFSIIYALGLVIILVTVINRLFFLVE